jgi:hypothetical protein
MAHITFIHGISNKPPEEELHKIWLRALAANTLGNKDGLDISSEGITSSMVYWADILYEKPMEQSSAEEESLSATRNFESTEAVAGYEERDPDMSWREYLSGAEKKLVESFAAKLSFDVLLNDEYTPREIDKSLERIPLPWFIKRRIMKQFLRDVHHYLFNYRFSPREGSTFDVQPEIRQRTIKALEDGSKKEPPHIVVSHSMGTIIAYDCLQRVKECPVIDGLLTIGSPLGIDEVQDKFAPEWTRENGFPGKLKGAWINVYDTLDPVTGFDGDISNDFKKDGNELIEIINEANWGAWRHNITKYFAGPKLREALAKLLRIT